VVLAARNRDVAALGDEQRVRHCLRVVTEDLCHLRGGLQEELIPVIAQAVLVVHRLPGTDAQQDVVRLVVAVAQVVDVVGAHERHAEVGGDWQQPVVDDPLLLDALILHLEEEVALAEDVLELRGGGNRLARVGTADFAGDLALEAAAEPNQALGVPCQQLLVDARFVIEALRVPGRDQLDEVLEADLVLGQQHQMVRGLTRRAALVEAATRRNVDLAAENRVDPALPRRVVEHHRREHIAVLGDRHRRLAEPGDLVQQLVDPAGAVEQRELGVQVQVDEVRHWRPRRCATAR
jgi:hypothetical protein